VGDEVTRGQFMTDGSADLSELFKYAGREKAQDYMISQINKIYELQGESVSRKHIEIIIRQMFSKVKVVEVGETGLSVGDVLDRTEFEVINDKTEIKGKAEALVLGIAEVALTKDSFLSAASFQHTNRILINSAIRGSVDELSGLKENVIIGRIIPAGTGFVGSEKNRKAMEIENEVMKYFDQMEA
jgi:DNA-directed RNA polymerase subunit beta'